MSGAVVSFAPAFVERRLEAALEADEGGDVSAALLEVEAALRLAPREPRARALAGVYAALLDRDADALRHARRALRSPEKVERAAQAEIAYWAAVARHIVGAQDSAVEALRLCLSISPDDASAKALLKRCRPSEARDGA